MMSIDDNAKLLNLAAMTKQQGGAGLHHAALWGGSLLQSGLDHGIYCSDCHVALVLVASVLSYGCRAGCSSITNSLAVPELQS